MRVVWFVLDDGRSVIAACGEATSAAVESVVRSSGAMIKVASDHTVEEIPTAAVRDFVVFEARGRFPDPTVVCPSLVL